MERFTKNNPQSNIDVLLNYAYVKDGEVYLRYAGGEEEKRLVDYIAELATEKGCKRTADDILADGCMECDCEVAVLYTCAIQAAELRTRLAELENKLESGQALELPFKVGEKVYLVRRNRNFKWVVSRTQVTMYLKHSRLLVKCACDSEWHEIGYLYANKKQADARLQEILEKQ